MVTLLSFLTSKTFLKIGVLQKYTKHTSYCAYPTQTAKILCIILCIFEVEVFFRKVFEHTKIERSVLPFHFKFQTNALIR